MADSVYMFGLGCCCEPDSTCDTIICVHVDDQCNATSTAATYCNGTWYTRYYLVDIAGQHDFITTNYASWIPAIAFSSNHVWDPANKAGATVPGDCTRFATGVAYYMYYWYCDGDGLHLVLRVFCDICPPTATILTGVVANGSGPYWVDFMVTGSGPGTYTFGKPTQYGGSGPNILGTVLGTGFPPAGDLQLPVASATFFATTIPAPYVAGVPVTITNQAGDTVASGTTDVYGNYCWIPPEVDPSANSPDLYLVSINKGSCRGDAPPHEEVVACGYTCVPTIGCPALQNLGLDANMDLTTTGASILDGHGTHALTYNFQKGYYESAQISFNADGFWDDSVYRGCYPGTMGLLYSYRVMCSGNQIVCQVITNPIKVCSYSNAVCGYYFGDYTYGTQPAPVVVFTGTFDPYLFDNHLTVNLTHSANTLCDPSINPPSAGGILSIPTRAQNRVLCGSPCPVPRRNLTLHWTRISPAGSGDIALVFNGMYWVGTGGYAFFAASGGLAVPGSGGSIPVLDNYTCQPFYLKYRSFNGVVYEVY